MATPKCAPLSIPWKAGVAPSFQGQLINIQRVRGADEALREARRLALFTSVQSGFVSVENFRKGLLSDLAPKL